MTLRELALKLRSRITFEGRLHVPDGFSEYPWVCQMENAASESFGWSGKQYPRFSGYGKTTAEAWESLAKHLQGKTILFRKHTPEWTHTFDVPADLVAGDPP